jgi:hypothetical protein
LIPTLLQVVEAVDEAKAQAVPMVRTVGREAAEVEKMQRNALAALEILQALLHLKETMVGTERTRPTMGLAVAVEQVALGQLERGV